MRRFVRTHRRVFVTLGLVAAVFGLRLAWRATAIVPAVAIAPPSEAVTAETDFRQLEHEVTHEAAPPAYRIVPAACDRMPGARETCLRVEIDLRDGKPVEVASVLPGLTRVPASWHVRLGVRLIPDSPSREVTVTALGEAQILDAGHAFHEFDAVACASQVMAALVVEPDPSGPREQHATLLLDPRLELAHCGW